MISGSRPIYKSVFQCKTYMPHGPYNMVHLIQFQIKSVEKRDKQYLKRIMVWRNILDTIKNLSNLQYTDMTVIGY